MKFQLFMHQPSASFDLCHPFRYLIYLQTLRYITLPQSNKMFVFHCKYTLSKETQIWITFLLSMNTIIKLPFISIISFEYLEIPNFAGIYRISNQKIMEVYFILSLQYLVCLSVLRLPFTMNFAAFKLTPFLRIKEGSHL